MFYLINFSSHRYAPADDPTSTKYDGLDMFYTSGVRSTDDAAKVFFQRAAKVYIFVGLRDDDIGTGKGMAFDGWRPEGLAYLKGESNTFEWGVYFNDVMTVPARAYVFSKVVEESVIIPTRDYIAKKVPGLELSPLYHVRVGEANGSPYSGENEYQGRVIKPNSACPESLHQAWMVPHKDKNDADVDGVLFSSWHPMWDPCYWCAYGHDHGSSPQHLMGYTPTYTYTARKNDREVENDEGFKGVVFRAGKYMVYFNIHIQTSQLRRVTERYHTVAVAVTDRETGKLMMEVSHKASFGFLAARGKKDPFLPLRREDEIERTRQLNSGLPHSRRFRTVNVVDKNNLDPRFRFQDDPLMGVYEAWMTMPICASADRFGEVQIDVKSPASGVKSVRQLDTRVELGRSPLRNVALSRNLRMMNLRLGAKHCKFGNGEVTGGVFYTDARGENLVEKGRKGVRQYITPGFEVTVSGKYEPFEMGLGEHADGHVEFFSDLGYGVDPNRN